MSFFNKSGIVNVKMVITEEKILSNIDKVQKLINPNSKKQIVQLEDDSYFKDLVESVKTYLLEYPKKKNFPKSVYKAAYDLVEYATNQFEENTKKVEELIRQREKNIKLASVLRDATTAVKARISNLESNLHIEIDMERIEDKSKALSYIGIEIAEAVSGSNEEVTENNFFEETRFEAKPTLWQRIKNSKFVQTIKYILSIKVVLEYPALPEGRGEY